MKKDIFPRDVNKMYHPPPYGVATMFIYLSEKKFISSRPDMRPFLLSYCSHFVGGIFMRISYL